MYVGMRGKAWESMGTARERRARVVRVDYRILSTYREMLRETMDRYGPSI